MPLLSIQCVGLGASFLGAVWANGLLSLHRYREILTISLAALFLGGALVAILVTLDGVQGAAIGTILFARKPRGRLVGGERVLGALAARSTVTDDDDPAAVAALLRLLCARHRGEEDSKRDEDQESTVHCELLPVNGRRTLPDRRNVPSARMRNKYVTSPLKPPPARRLSGAR